MNAPSPKLPRNADELLRDFPLDEPDFEAQAQAIEARLGQQLESSPLDDVLGSPQLSAEPGEPTAAPPRNFTEMARKSLQQPSSDDGAALAKELLAATSHARRPDAEMVARVRAAGKASTTATPLPGAERPSGVVARPAAAVPPSSEPAPGSKRGVIIATLGAALALAAGVALFARSGSPEAPAAPGVAAAPAPLAAEPRAAQAAEPAAKTTTPRSPSDEGVLNPDALALAPATKTSDANPSAAKAAAGGAAAPAVKAAAVKPESVALSAADPSTTAPGTEPHREPAAEPPLKPAEGSAESMPLSPSGGAVSTALGSVRPDAQACLAGQSGSVVAVVTFASDGHVTSVTAGGSSGDCIRSALSKARIAPFAKDHFSATTTIRAP